MIVIKNNEDFSDWVAIGRGYPYLSFDIKSTNFYFICYDMFTEKVFLKLNLEYLSNSEFLEKKGFKIEID